jgi:hypothetical protein|tara:strand:+ start:159 stop:479 length:321 start_codon:yes stop_codon:yes gene_type:complete
MDIQAIIRAYPNASYVDETTVKDVSGNVITTEQSKIDAARVTLDSEAAAIKYQTDRTTDGSITYDTIGNQLDQLYHDINAGKFGSDAKTGEWFVGISSVKTANPKP